MKLHSKTETLTLRAPFRTLGREHVGAISSLLQRIPGAGEGRAAHGHLRTARPRRERLRRRNQALGHRDGAGRRRLPAGGGPPPPPPRPTKQAAGGLSFPPPPLPPPPD